VQAAEIMGVVWDATGSVLPAAQISAVNVHTGVLRRTISNQSGYYSIPFLQPGSYRLTVRREGFMVATGGDVRLVVGQRFRLDVTMAVARVMETVQVHGDGLLEDSSSGLGEVISEEAVSALPLNGRNYTQLLTLTAGATPVSTAQGSKAGPTDGAVTGIPDSPVVRPSFHGQQNRSQIVYLDGIINTDFRISTYALAPNLDLLQEFKVQAHSEKVEWGGVTGGIINLVSKSGTNQFHGSGFWFVRNDVLDARDPFKDGQRNAPVPFRQNQFGATLGGPLIHDRTFFSGGYEGWRYRKPSQSFGRVPTNAELTGDFSNSIVARDIFNPFTTTRTTNGSLLRTPFPDNRIPASLLSPMTQGFLETYAERPNLADPVFNFINNHSTRDDADGFQIKIDHLISENDSVFFRWTRLVRDALTPGGAKSQSGSQMISDNWGGGWLHMFSPNVILNVRGGVARRDFLDVFLHSAGLDPMRQLGFTDVDRFGGLQMRLSEPWGDISPRGPAQRQNPTRSASADLTWVRGDHTFKGGYQQVNVRRLQTNRIQTYEFDDHVTSHPQFLGTTGASLASALLGLPVRFSGILPEEGAINFGLTTWSAYFQDEWRASPTLTINLGLRFDHNRKPSLASGLMAGPDLDRGLWLIGAETMPPPCNQTQKAPCIPGNGLEDVPHGDRIVLAGSPNYIPMEIWDNWGPRIGVAWRVSDKIVVRGGYGMYWDTLIGNSQYTQHNVEGRWPASTGFSGSANELGAAPRRIQEIQGQFPAVLPEPTPWEATGWVNDPERRNAYSHQWNIEVQRQFNESLMASLAYVGSFNGQLDYTGLANTALQPGPGAPDEIDQRRPVPFLGGGLFYSRSIAQSNYNSLQCKVRRRFSEGLQTQLSYTWSKSIDDSSGWFGAENGPGGSAGIQNYHDPLSNRSVSSYNIPHFLSWYTVWELPFGATKRWFRDGLAARILGGWQTNSILQWRSGQPFNLAVSGDVANIGAERRGWNYARPNLVGDPRLEHPTVDRYFNVDAFAIPRFEYGNFGRNVLASDSVFNTDFSLFRTVPLRHAEHPVNLQLRFEAFNVFNHIDWAPPGTTIGDTGAGRISEVAHAPRILQLGLRLTF
jgi:outer membrane receptor protein involved in Fe transport